MNEYRRELSSRVISLSTNFISYFVKIYYKFSNTSKWILFIIILHISFKISPKFSISFFFFTLPKQNSIRATRNTRTVTPERDRVTGPDNVKRPRIDAFEIRSYDSTDWKLGNRYASSIPGRDCCLLARPLCRRIKGEWGKYDLLCGHASNTFANSSTV